ncbi:glycosyltransferase family 4 protein [Montanilutibacter psychrotolerans]|uniref:Glycosyltransferase family 1 protein n=1 Tax=Montanilutibacter psychrotolerans TaxID=1327343 RepID=A0A3M8SUX1_9GAMM|nr:glycosyltransferase family 4 protein [Lysobacter psychrotolerans]RNF84495.1 glycosyltransferase family 1 protein [Lysobacter psychrotolerans]
MKLLLTNFHDGDGGGHTTYVLALARGLAPRHEVHVAAPEGSRLYREAAASLGVHALAQAFPNGLKRLAARLRARAQLAAYLREHDFDVVHVNGSADHRLVMSALRGLPQRPRIVLTKHNSKPMTGLGHAWRARRGTDMVIAVCDHTRTELAGTAYRRCLHETVHNGVDIARYAPWPASQAATERRRWADDDTLLLGSNAGTATYKGWMDLVEALAALPTEQRTRVRVLLAGKPPGSEQRARIEQLGLSAQVQFTGLLDDVRPVIAAIDAGFVLSWDVETISFACREMMAMARPVLVSNYAGLPENIQPDIDGWVVPVRDRTAIGAAIQHLLRVRDQLQGMGAAAHAHAQAEFGLERFVDRTEAAYQRLLDATPG